MLRDVWNTFKFPCKKYDGWGDGSDALTSTSSFDILPATQPRGWRSRYGPKSVFERKRGESDHKKQKQNRTAKGRGDVYNNMNEYVSVSERTRMNTLMHAWMNEWMDGWVNERMSERASKTNEGTNERPFYVIRHGLRQSLRLELSSTWLSFPKVLPFRVGNFRYHTLPKNIIIEHANKVKKHAHTHTHTGARTHT